MSRFGTVFDPHALSRNRSRAQPDALFLHHAARDEIQDRLSMVNRSFKDAVIVTPFADIWREVFPDAICIPDQDTLDIGPDSFDLVIHAMALHWAEAPVGQIIQCRRALRADSLFLCVSLGGQTLYELRAVLAQAEAEITGGLSPRIAPMAELRDLGGLLQRGGFALPVADSVPLNVEYTDSFALMHDLRAMGEGNALSGRLRHPSRRAVMQRANEIYQTHFPGQDGRIRATFDLICLTGWAPDDSQPQPLRPGSAPTRLADALKTTETKLPD